MATADLSRRIARPSRATTGSQLDELLLGVVDAGLAGCVFVVPLLMGGRQALGQLVLVALAAVVATAWALRLCSRRDAFWQRSAGDWLLAAGAVVLLVQVVPLPAGVLAALAPHTAEMLPMWAAGGDQTGPLGRWATISLTPGATQNALAIYLAYALLFLVTVQRIRRLEDVERLLQWTALSAILMAGFGLLQLLTTNGKFFWIYEHPFSTTADSAKGSFTNRNHFAHFLALGVGPLIWWLQSESAGRLLGMTQRNSRDSGEFRSQRQAFGLRALALCVVAFAGLLSLSRGGLIVMFLAAAIMLAVCYRARALSGRVVLAMGGAAAVIGMLLAIHGYDRVSGRMDTLRSGSLEALDQDAGRRTIWAAVLKAVPDYAIFGSGVGSHREVYPMYLDKPVPTEYTHAENGYLQSLLETGVAGFTLIVAGIGLCSFWCVAALRRARSPRTLVCAGAIAASLAANVVHSGGDFVWYVPGCMVLVAILAACAFSLRRLGGEQSGRPVARARIGRMAAVLATVAAIGMGIWMIAGRLGAVRAEPHWDRYRIMVLAQQDAATAALEVEAETEGTFALDDAVGRLDVLNGMIAELEQVVEHDPGHARAHLRLAAAYVRRFDLARQQGENSMPLAQIRDAALQARAMAADEATRQKTEQWLQRTLGNAGDDLHQAITLARRGVALCPLQGEGYLYLSALEFLTGPEADSAKHTFLDQALRVRPYDGDVLFEVGREAWLAGRFDQGLRFWQAAFRAGRDQQQQLIGLLAGRVPVQFLIDNFKPDLVATRLLHRHYGAIDQPEELMRLRRYYAGVAAEEASQSEGEAAALVWLEARRMSYLTGDLPKATEYARAALRCAPNNYQVRYVLGNCLLEQHDYAGAQQHLQWCLDRRPNEPGLREMVGKVARKRVEAETNPVYQARVPQQLR